MRNNQFKAPGAAAYSVFQDVDGSASIFGADVVQVRNRQFSLLPAGEPSAPAAPSAPASAFSAPATALAPLVAGDEVSSMRARPSAQGAIAQAAAFAGAAAARMRPHAAPAFKAAWELPPMFSFFAPVPGTVDQREQRWRWSDTRPVGPSALDATDNSAVTP